MSGRSPQPLSEIACRRPAPVLGVDERYERLQPVPTPRAINYARVTWRKGRNRPVPFGPASCLARHPLKGMFGRAAVDCRTFNPVCVAGALNKGSRPWSSRLVMSVSVLRSREDRGDAAPEGVLKRPRLDDHDSRRILAMINSAECWCCRCIASAASKSRMTASVTPFSERTGSPSVSSAPALFGSIRPLTLHST